MVYIYVEFLMWVDVIMIFEKKKLVLEDKWCIIKFLIINVVNRILFFKLKKSIINLKFMKCFKYWERMIIWLYLYILLLFCIEIYK